jgi:hypothetical protein
MPIFLEMPERGRKEVAGLTPSIGWLPCGAAQFSVLVVYKDQLRLVGFHVVIMHLGEEGDDE